MSLTQAMWLFYRHTRRWPKSLQEINRLRKRYPDQGAFSAHVRGLPERKRGGPLALPKWAIKATRKVFGADAGYLMVPELAPILMQSAGQGFDAIKTQRIVESTAWWRKHTQQQQQWLRLSPAEREQAIQRTSIVVVESLRKLYGRDYVQQSGWDLSSDQVNRWATRVASGAMPVELFLFRQANRAEKIEDTPAWNGVQQELREEGAAAVAIENQAGKLEDAWRQWLGDTVDPIDMEFWAKRIYNNRASLEDFEDYLEQQATSLYPGKPPTIPFATWIAPAKQLISGALELGNVDDGDALVQSYARGEVGSLADLADRVRNDPRFTRTDRFASQSRDLTHSVLQAFGLR